MNTKTPTNEQLRIAVAELRGILKYQEGKVFNIEAGAAGLVGTDAERFILSSLPPFDYNTLALARKELLATDDLKYRFTLELARVIIRGTNLTGTCDWYMVDAAPEPQAIALCKVFGKEIE